MRRNAFFPLLIPIVLLAVSFWKAGVVELYFQARALERRSSAAQVKLDQLRAVAVAARIDEKKYQNLVVEFAELAGLRLEEEFAVSKGEVAGQLGRFVDAVVEELNAQEPSERDNYLLFRSVTPGQRQVFEPFLAVDFVLNLEGRFFALPQFLDRLSSIAAEQKCAISIGELKVASVYRGGNTGELSITLPLRAYFLEK